MNFAGPTSYSKAARRICYSAVEHMKLLTDDERATELAEMSPKKPAKLVFERLIQAKSEEERKGASIDVQVDGRGWCTVHHPWRSWWRTR
jgi:hypothetical protein